MNNNNGCGCTPNQSIKCTVSNCAHHCQDTQYCGLNTIQVGTHETNPTKPECTDCPELPHEITRTGMGHIPIPIHTSVYTGWEAGA